MASTFRSKNMKHSADDGSKFELESDGLHIRVGEVRDHRIEGTIVRVLPKENPDNEESGQNSDEQK